MSNKINLSKANLDINEAKNTSIANITRGKKKNKKHKLKKQKISNRVFVVHGHDKALLDETVTFLKKINLDVIVSMDLANKGHTILEKIETSSGADFGVVLYTPCDVGAKNTGSPKMRARARQNVVFEHGYLLAKLGRNRVFTLTKGKLELPSDISGTLHISTEDPDWRSDLTAEFMAVKLPT